MLDLLSEPKVDRSNRQDNFSSLPASSLIRWIAENQVLLGKVYKWIGEYLLNYEFNNKNVYF